MESRDGTVEHFPVELVAHVGVLVVEESVGPGAAGVDALLRLLHERPVAAVHVVRQLARLVVTFAGGERFNSKKNQLALWLLNLWAKLWAFFDASILFSEAVFQSVHSG